MLEVGETISLSNQNKISNESDSYQVITIKEIDFNDEQQEEQLDVSYEEQLNDISDNISQAKKQLHVLKKEQAQLLESTKEQINFEKEKWKKEKKLERQEAEKAGYEDGFNAGKNEAMEQYESLLNEINHQYDLAITDYYQIIDNHRQTIINLAMTTANKIMDEELANNPEKFQNIVTKVMNNLKDNETITIIVHPNNYQYVSEQREELEQLIDEDGIITLQVDQSLNEGDCIIKHRFGQIDASIDVQLQQIKTALKESVSEN